MRARKLFFFFGRKGAGDGTLGMETGFGASTFGAAAIFDATFLTAGFFALFDFLVVFFFCAMSHRLVNNWSP